MRSENQWYLPAYAGLLMSNLRGKSPPHPVELVKPPGCMRSVGSQRRGLPPPPRTQRRIASKCKLSPDTGDGAKRFAWSAAARSTARLATLLSGCMLNSSSVVKLERERRRRVLRRLFPLLLLRIAAIRGSTSIGLSVSTYTALSPPRLAKACILLRLPLPTAASSLPSSAESRAVHSCGASRLPDASGSARTCTAASMPPL